MPRPEHAIFEFGPFRLDASQHLLFRNGQLISLAPKAAETLVILVENHGRLVKKSELMKAVWPDCFVEEANLAVHISQLRKTLGDDTGNHYIETIPRRGYRFIGQVRLRPDTSVLEPAPKPLVVPAVPDSQLALTRTSVEAVPDSPAGVTDRRVPTAPPPRIARNPRKWGLTAAAAIALVAFGGTFILPIRSKPILTENDAVLISDFVNTTGDPVFDDTLKQAISVQLSQSPFLNIISDARIDATLKLMAKPANTKLTPDIARDLCQRAGGKTYITGSIVSLGSQYVIGLRAINCQTGDFLAQEQVLAKSKEQVLKSLDGAARSLRQKVGESLSSIQKFDMPLATVTTPSLDALKAYSVGLRTESDALAIPFFQRAIELDPDFALAYANLGLSQSNLEEPGLASKNIGKAYELRDRVSEREKFSITAEYHQMVTGELEKADQTCELWAQAYPRDYLPHNLLGANYEFQGQYEKALGETLEAVRLNPDSAVLYSNLMEDYSALNRLNEAKSTYRQALELRRDHPFLHADMYAIAFLEGDTAEMERQVAWTGGKAGAEDWLLSFQSDSNAYSGHLRKARDLSRRAAEFALHNNQMETAALWQMNAALREAEFGNPERALRDVNAGLAIASTRDVQILAALARARADDSVEALKMAEDLAKNFPLNTVLNDYWLPTIRGAIEINRGSPSKAVEILRVAAPHELGAPNPQISGGLLYPVYVRGQAYLLLGKGREAAAEFQKFLDHRGIVFNYPLGPLARLGLARAYALQRDFDKSRAAYQDFFGLWKDADPDIPVFLAAKSEYARLR